MLHNLDVPVRFPYTGVALRHQMWPFVMPARRPRSPLDQATTGRLKVSTQDELSAALIVLPSCQCAQAVVVRRLEWELYGALDKYVVAGVYHEAPLVIQTVAPAKSGQPKPVVDYGLLGDLKKKGPQRWKSQDTGPARAPASPVASSGATRGC